MIRDTIRRLMTACVAGAAVAVMAHRVSAQSGVLAGQVVDKEANVPLPYAGVSIIGRSIERLTGDEGRFRIPDLGAGVIHLRVRRVGYAPIDTQVTILANDTTTITLALAHIAVRLAAMHVTDEPCRLPGAPSLADANLAAVFEQLTLNAEQFRLVNKQYPFNATFDRYYSHLVTGRLASAGDSLDSNSDTVDVAMRSDTAWVRSDRPWKYKPGEVIVPAGIGLTGVQYGVEIPTLAVFADPDFIKTHCFQDAGEVTFEGQMLRRIDFRASAKIRDPDLDGSIYLDTSTFVIRRSQVSLSRPSEHASSYTSISVETFFDELVPGVPVIMRTNGRSTRTADAAQRDGSQALPQGERIFADAEEQRVRDIRFVHGAPNGRDAAIHRSRLVGVFDGETGEALPRTVVRDSQSGKSVLTGALGSVGLTFIEQPNAVIIIEHAGFQREALTVSLTAHDTVPLTVVLRRSTP